MKILTIGAALTDILVDVPSELFLDKLGFPKASMTYVNKVKQTEILKLIGALKPVIKTGGSAANCAAVAAYLGGQTGFIGCVGDDEIGLNFNKQLEVRGVEAKLKISKIEASGAVVCMVSEDGERTMATYLGASADVNEQMLTQEMFVGYDFLFVEGYLVYNKPYMEKAMTLAKQAGMKVAFDMGSFNVVQQNREYMEEVIKKYVDIVFANEQEAINFGELDGCADIVVRKLGAEGAVVHCNGKEYRVKADKNVEVRDKTGAGDAFAGGFLYGLCKGENLQICAEYGAVVADKIVQVVGCNLK